MKRIAYISLVALLLCFAACEKTGSSEGEGAGAEIGIRLPGGTSYVSGQDVIVLGSGFSASDTFILMDAGGTETVIQGVTVTSSGFFFTLSVSAGTYSLVVLAENGERREIGVITVSERTLSIVVSNVPGYCLPGTSLTVSATGAEEGAELVIETESGVRTPLVTSVSESTLTATVPDDGPRGKMRLLIVQDGAEMVLSEAFFVTSRKRLTAVEYTIGVGMGMLEYQTGLHLTRGADGSVTGCTEYVFSMTGAADSGSGADAALADGTWNFVPLESPDDYLYSDSEFTLEVSESRVVSYDNGSRVFSWTYEGDGYLSYAVGNGSGGTTFWFDVVEGNLVDEDWSSRFQYEDNTLVRNPFAVDFGLAALAATNDIFRIALAFGLTGTASTLLPSAFDDGAVTYEFDDEGYPVRARYTEPQSSFPTEVEFTYE